MNIFFLHRSAPLAAAYHCDKHVGKMLIESCQLLATAHHQHGNGDSVTYKSTHVNHPSAVWVRTSPLHYEYVRLLASYLAREFFRRYGKVHASSHILHDELRLPPPALAAAPHIWQDPPQAMPDQYKGPNTVEAYRAYYASKAKTMPLVYYRGEQSIPIWLRDALEHQQAQEAA
jgi:hypothetical protein